MSQTKNVRLETVTSWNETAMLNAHIVVKRQSVGTSYLRRKGAKQHMNELMERNLYELENFHLDSQWPVRIGDSRNIHRNTAGQFSIMVQANGTNPKKNCTLRWYVKCGGASDGTIKLRWSGFLICERMRHSIQWDCVQNDVKLLTRRRLWKRSVWIQIGSVRPKQQRTTELTDMLIVWSLSRKTKNYVCLRKLIERCKITEPYLHLMAHVFYNCKLINRAQIQN